MQTKLTYLDYVALPEDGKRHELIDGELIEMSAPSFQHQAVVFELAGQLRNYMKGKTFRGVASPIDVRLVFAGQNQDRCINVVQPDLVVVCDRAKVDRRGIVGAPDFVLEVLSPSSQMHDRQLKLNLYEQFGVCEYWIVDAQPQTVDIYRHDGERFLVPERFCFDRNLAVHAVAGLAFDLEELARELDLLDGDGA